MDTKNRRIITVTLIALLTSIFTAGCGREKQENTTSEIPVKVIRVQVYSIDRTLDFTGNIQPWKKTNLGAQMPGTIRKIFVEAGDRVKKDDLLVQMDDAQLTQARVRYELAKLDYERMKPLLDEGSISPSQFDKIKGNYKAAKAGYELTLENTRIRAPFSGVISKKWMNEGEVFTLMPGPAGSPTILTLMQIDRVKILISIPESELPRIKNGLEAQVKVDILPDKVFHGVISRIDPAIDPASRTFQAEIKLDNRSGDLHPGMFARVRVNLGSDRVVAVPRSTLIRQTGSNILYGFVIKNSTAERREIVPGQRFDDLVEIKRGLLEGEPIVIEGLYQVKNGSKVKVVTTNTEEQN